MPDAYASSVLGYRRGVDSEDPPAAFAEFPWHTALALGAAFAFGHLGWHWSYVLPLFWLLLNKDDSRRRRLWSMMKRDLVVGASAAREDRKDDESVRGETVTWVNQLLRAVWPMYEPAVARWAQNLTQPTLNQYMPRSLGVFALRIKKFSFGSVSNSAARNRRLAPLLIEHLKMVSKSVDASSPDPRQHRIHFVLQADVRWHTGSTPVCVLDIQLGPKLLSLTVDAEVKPTPDRGETAAWPLR